MAAPDLDAPRRPRRAGRARIPVTLLVAVLAVLVVLAAGCLPSGTRGSGSPPTGADGSTAGSSGQLPTPPGSPTPRPTIVPPTPTPAPTFLVHVVAAGESLNTIAQRYGTTGRSIAFWNRSTYPSLDPYSAAYRPDLLKVGWTLFLIPNDVVDEQDLPDPSVDATGPDHGDESAIP